MNNDFPRRLSLLRKERHISQKQVAQDLGVAQALLSHYEKGKRECGLDFLVKAADYYKVSTDYLLGRSPVSSGSVITENDIPEGEGKAEGANLTVSLTKKLINNSIDIIYSLLAKTKNPKLTQSISNLLSFTVYRAFRLTYKANPKNDKNIFSIPEELAYRSADAGISLAEGKAMQALADEQSEEAPEITTATLEQNYKTQAAALLNLVVNCEAQLKKLD